MLAAVPLSLEPGFLLLKVTVAVEKTALASLNERLAAILVQTFPGFVESEMTGCLNQIESISCSVVAYLT